MRDIESKQLSTPLVSVPISRLNASWWLGSVGGGEKPLNRNDTGEMRQHREAKLLMYFLQTINSMTWLIFSHSALHTQLSKLYQAALVPRK